MFHMLQTAEAVEGVKWFEKTVAYRDDYLRPLWWPIAHPLHQPGGE